MSIVSVLLKVCTERGHRAHTELQVPRLQHNCSFNCNIVPVHEDTLLAIRTNAEAQTVGFHATAQEIIYNMQDSMI